MSNRILVLLLGNIRYDGRVKKEISSLIKFGYEVALIVSEFDVDDQLENYNFKIYYAPKKKSKNIIGKVKSVLNFKRKLDNVIKEFDPHFLHCNDLAVVYAYGWFKKTKVVYDAHELVTEMYTGKIKKMVHWAEKYAVKRVFKVILPQIDRLNYFYFLYKDQIRKEQLFMLENFPNEKADLSERFFEERYKYVPDDSVKVMSYVGSINSERGIDNMIEALVHVKNIVFFVIGNARPEYTEYLRKLIKDNSLSDRVFLHPPIPNEEVLTATNSSDIGVCFYNSSNLNSYFCASNKLYENLNCGVHVLTNDIAGTARIIRNGENGYRLENITTIEIVTALQSLVTQPKLPKSEFFWEKQDAILKSIYS